MKNNIESGLPRIRISGNNASLRSVEERGGIHCLVEQRNEPVSQLTPGDKQSYYVMLKRFGVPREDRKKAAAIAVNFCTTTAKSDTQGHTPSTMQTSPQERAHTKTDLIRDVIGNFKEVINRRKGDLSTQQTVPVTQEIVSFERKS